MSDFSGEVSVVTPQDYMRIFMEEINKAGSVGAASANERVRWAYQAALKYPAPVNVRPAVLADNVVGAVFWHRLPRSPSQWVVVAEVGGRGFETFCGHDGQCYHVTDLFVDAAPGETACEVRVPPVPVGTPDADRGFYVELVSLLNRYSKENQSDTPDYALAEFLIGCLESFDRSVKLRERFFDRPCGGGVAITGGKVLEEGQGRLPFSG